MPHTSSKSKSKFDKLISYNEDIDQFAKQNNGAEGFFAQEVLRFISIALLIRENKEFTLDTQSTFKERALTHPLARSLLENFFTIMYIFDDPKKTSTRYEKLKNSFKREYRNLYHSLNQEPWKNLRQSNGIHIPLPQSAWGKIKDTEKLPSVEARLRGIKNTQADKLDYLYVLYRITSFDTHGRSSEALFRDVFPATNEPHNFPVLNIKFAFECIASEYLSIWHKLKP